MYGIIVKHFWNDEILEMEDRLLIAKMSRGAGEEVDVT